MKDRNENRIIKMGEEVGAWVLSGLWKGVVFFILLFAGLAGVAQNPADRLDSLSRQYWFLRERMHNDFMLGVGPEQGQSLICYRRASDRAMKFGDNTIKLGHYVSLLATEYALLSRQGEDLLPTTRELFYAMYAINRLDLEGENYFRDAAGQRGKPTLNGFMVRDDVATLNPALLPRLNTDSSLIRIDKVRSDYLDTLRGPFINTPSQDQVIYLLSGLSLVISLLPQDAAYREDGSVYAFQDGEVSFVKEAKRMIERMVTYMFTPPWTWNLINPVTGMRIPERNGGSALALSWGFHGVMKQWAGSSLRGAGEQEIMYERLYQTYSKPAVFRRIQRSGEGDKILMLAALTNAWGSESFDLILKLSKDQKGLYQFDQIPLLSRILFPGSESRLWNPDIEQKRYFDLLNELPCGIGPYHHGPQSPKPWPAFEWSANDRIVEPEQRGHKGKAHWYGDFSGFDWMLYHNLYRLTFNQSEGFYQPYYLSHRIIGPNSNDLNISGKSILTRPLQVTGMNVIEGGPTDTLWLSPGCSQHQASIVLMEESTLAIKGLVVVVSEDAGIILRNHSNLVLMDGAHLIFQQGSFKQFDPSAVLISTGESRIIEASLHR
jgi:hypothetical protein